MGLGAVVSERGSIAGSADAYASQIAALAQDGSDAEHAVRLMTSDDVRSACDVFADVFAESGGTDGRVSIKVDPRLARNTEATIAEAQEEIQQVVEGVLAAEAVHQVAESLGVEMPICKEIYRILYQSVPPREALRKLMRRALVAE